MLRVAALSSPSNVTPSAVAMPIRPLDVAGYLAAARRRSRLVILTAALVAAAVVAVAAMMPRSYQASTRILIDPRGIQVLDKDPTPRSGTTDQVVSVVESEMRVATSDRALEIVIERMKLADDPEFNGTRRYVWSPVTDVIDAMRAMARSLAGDTSRSEPRAIVALRALQKATYIRREPQSFVVDLLVRTEDAAKSARIADALAAIYVDARTTPASGATRRASDAMSGRLAELRQRLEEAEARTQAFKRENDIVVASGRLVGEQQLSELNSQLVAARADRARAVVRLEQIEKVRRTGLDPDSIPEALASEAVLRLKGQYAAIRRREASLLATLLPSHPLMRQVRQELADSRRQISEEIKRISEAARLDVERTKSNEATLERNLTELKALSTRTSEKLAKLNELQLEVDAARTLYNQFLQRGGELAEQQKVPTSLAVVLSPAVPPKSPLGVPMTLIGPMGLLAGLGLGLVLAIARDKHDPMLRGADQLTSLGAPGEITNVTDLNRLLPSPEVSPSKQPTPSEVAQLVPSFVLSHPDGEPARGVRHLVETISQAAGRSEGTTVLVTSASQQDGKSAIAVNLALSAAQAGDKVLLIDGDLERRLLSVAIDAASHPGLSEVIAGEREASAVVLHVPALKVDVLPAGRRTVRLAGKANRLVEQAVQDLVAPYDVVVVDGGLLPHGRLLTAWSAVAADTVVVTRAGVSRKASVSDALATARDLPGGRLRTVFIS